MFKKIISALTAVLIAATACPISASAIPYDEYMSGRAEYTSATYEISPGLSFSEVLTENEKYGYERSYVYEYTPMQGTVVIPAYGDSVCGLVDLATLTKKFEDSGMRVVGGINGDFYNMGTGVPIGAMIVDGEIISSDNDRTAMGFDSDGKAFISKPQIVTKLTNDKNDITVEHINKYPLEYSLYLLTDKFYQTTRSTKPSTEIVLMPYSASETIETEEDMPGESTEPSDDPRDETEEEKYVYIYSDDINGDEEESANTDAAADGGETAVAGTAQQEDVQTGIVQPDGNIGTETTGGENPADEESSESAPQYYAKKYTVSYEKLKIGCDIPVVIKEIRKDSTDSEIPEGCFVLCAENTLQLDRVKNLSVGDELVLSVTADEQWYGAVHAIGNAGGLILKDGEYCDDIEVDHYPYAHPRTAAGITADGRVIFYCVDGRQKSSAGLRIDQLSHEMKELGCVIAINFDGGGSTTAYAALPGEFSSTRKNSPSVNPERKTTNSLLFVNTTERVSNEPARYSIYPERPYVLAGGSGYKLGKPNAVDENFYPVSLPDDFAYEYFVSAEQTDSVIVDGNVFISGKKSGAVDIFIRVGTGDDRKEYTAGTVFVLESPESFSVGEAEYTVSPFEVLKLALTAEYHTAKIYYDTSSLRWLLPYEDKAEAEPGTESEIDLTGSDSEHTDEKDTAQDPEQIPVQDSEQNPAESEDTQIALPEDTGSMQENSDESFRESENKSETDSDGEKETGDGYLAIPGEGYLENSKVSLKIASGTEVEIAPKIQDEIIELGVKFGNLEKNIKINVKKFPFTDCFTHWSAKNVYSMYDYELMQGEPDGDGLAFRPERNMTKSEFITVMARMLYPEIDDENLPDEGAAADSVTEALPGVDEQAADADAGITRETLGFADEADIPEWAYKYFCAMNERGLLTLLAKNDENGNSVIAPGEYITRREVLIMLGALCDEAKADFVISFVDGEILTGEVYYEFINNAVAAKIFEGYEDGTLRPENNLTRAEAATVVLRFFDSSFFN